jgi:hypothetical protein
MGMWLYQINARIWDSERYRVEIWEGNTRCWPVKQKRPAGADPLAGPESEIR